MAKANAKEIEAQLYSAGALGGIAAVITGLSLSHLAYGITIATATGGSQPWALAIGIDLGMIVTEVATLTGGERVRRETRWYSMAMIADTLVLSACKNAFAFSSQAGTLPFEIAGVVFGIAVPPRRREQAWCEALVLPKVFDGSVHPLNPSEQAVPASGALRGISICGGVVEGTARVLHDLHDCETLAAGEIMVAPVTDLAWTPYFLRAGGLVVEIGGLLSHGSIVAREYGLPAIMGVADATRRIRTGDRIRLDANRGLVEVVPVGGDMGVSPSPR